MRKNNYDLAYEDLFFKIGSYDHVVIMIEFIFSIKVGNIFIDPLLRFKI